MSVTPKITATKEEGDVRCEITGYGADVIRMWASLTGYICNELQIKSLDELIVAATYIVGREGAKNE